MNSPKISVVLPVYNAAEYLPSAIKSITDQTFTEFEVIAINDGSTDGSGAILDTVAKNDDRFRVIHQSNKGLVATLNLGVSLANASLVARMDADDISTNDRFEKQFALFKDEAALLAVGGYQELEENTPTVIHTPPSRSDSIHRSLYLQNYLGHGTAIFRKDAFTKAGGYSEHVGPVEDYDLWIRLSKVGKIVSTTDVVYLWRVNEDGITSSKNKYQEECAQSLRKNLWRDSLPRPVDAHTLKASTWSKVDLEIEARLFIHFLRNRQYGEGLRQLSAILASLRACVSLLRQLTRIAYGRLRPRVHA